LLHRPGATEPIRLPADALRRLCETALSRLARDWVDPPTAEEVKDGIALLRPLLSEAAALLSATFPPRREGRRSELGIWVEPLLAPLLPFWEEAAGAFLPTLLAVAEPAVVARSLSVEGCTIPLGLALYERYLRLAVSSLASRPVFVAPAGASRAEMEEQLGSFLTNLGGESGAASIVWTAARGAGGEDRVSHGGAAPQAAQLQLAEALAKESGPHSSFAAPALGDESPWTRALLAERHSSERLWRGLDWLAGQVAGLGVGAEVASAAGREAVSEYPRDCSGDDGRYHEWLRRRGLSIRTGRTAELRRPATEPGPAPVLSVVFLPADGMSREAAGRSLNSVLEQDDGAYELVVVASGSALEAPLLDRLGELSPGDRRIVLLGRSGASDEEAVNRAADSASGELLMVLRPGDELGAGAVRRVVRALGRAEPTSLLYFDEDRLDEEGVRRSPLFKPGWSSDLLLSTNYVGPAFAISRAVFLSLGGLKPEAGTAADYDLVLRAAEQIAETSAVHLPEVLFHKATGMRPLGAVSGDSRGAAEEAVRRRAAGRRRRRGRRGKGQPLVSAIVPFRDEPSLLAACYRAFVASPGHDEFELILVDNDSALPETRAVTAELSRDRRVRLLEAPGPFDWAAINNDAVEKARGELLLFLNNDVEARSPGWLGQMVAEAGRPHVGAVGAKLVFPDGRLQHGGVAIGVLHGAGHIQLGLPAGLPGYLGLVSSLRDVSAVTGACMLTSRQAFEAVGGFDRQLPLSFNDIDYCLKLRRNGMRVIYTPLAELAHRESATTGHADDEEALAVFWGRWKDLIIAGDPHFNPNLSRCDIYCRLPSKEDDELWETFRSTLSRL
jgi:GT2 family glycosyltransferase